MGQINASFPLGKDIAIAEYKNALDADKCAQLVSCLTEDFNTLFELGPTVGGYNPLMKNCMDTSFMNAEQYTPDLKYFRIYSSICEEFNNDVWSCVADYVEHYQDLWSAPGLHCTGFRIQRYERNVGFYRRHCDAQPWFPIDDGTNSARILAVIVYLNTVEEGGGTSFPEHGLITKAEVGKVVIFPTTWLYPHQGMVPLSNDKWIISQFINCAVTPIQNENTKTPVVNVFDDSSFVTPEASVFGDE